MTEPSLSPAAEAADRDRTIDSLLVTGLDRYFAGDYERAIHAWTRVLFLDRSHARARAYIERARNVLAERQRETDALLHRGLAALDAGDTDAARTLLASAVRRGGPVEAAEAALERLDRLEVASGADGALVSRVTSAPALEARSPRSSRRLVSTALAIAAVVLLVVAAMFAFGWSRFDPGGPEATGRASTIAPVRPESRLPYPELAELSLRRARALHSRGHLHEALRELSAVRADDPRRAEADRLTAELQRALLTTTEIAQPSVSDGRATPGRP
jgi:hypothetical protein